MMSLGEKVVDSSVTVDSPLGWTAFGSLVAQPVRSKVVLRTTDKAMKLFRKGYLLFLWDGRN
jgi:hypothetical protein